MREYRDVQKTTTVTECIRVVCDLCKREGNAARVYPWASGVCFTVDVDDTQIDVTVRRSEGRVYPEGGVVTDTSVDMCPECFETKLIPWLRSQGAYIREYERDV